MIAIIGGGISGLSLAYFLALQGRKVAVFEKEDRLGGTCRWLPLGDNVVDAYYHVMTSGLNPLMNLVNELGLDQSIYPIKISQAFFRGGRIYPASTIMELLLFSALSPLDRARLALTVGRAVMRRRWQELDLRTAKEWLVALGGRNLYERFWQPIMTCKFGPATDRVVATDMWFRIRRFGEVSRPGQESGACYFRGTLRLLFDTLEQRLNVLGVQVLKKRPVRRLLVEQGRVRGVEGEDGSVLDVDGVVSTAPLPDFAELLPDDQAVYKMQLARIEYLHNVCLILQTSKPISPYYQLNLGESDMPFTGVIGADCFYPPADYGGYVTYLPRYFIGESDLFSKDTSELINDYLPYLQRINPEFKLDWIQSMTVSQGRNIEPLHTVDYKRRIPSAQTPIQGLYLLSTAQIYPQPTILDVVVAYAHEMAKRLVREVEVKDVR